MGQTLSAWLCNMCADDYAHVTQPKMFPALNISLNTLSQGAGKSAKTTKTLSRARSLNKVTRKLRVKTLPSSTVRYLLQIHTLTERVGER